MMDLIDNDGIVKERRRPLLLSVLCILTWVGSTAQFLWAVFILWDAYRDFRHEAPLSMLLSFSSFAIASVLTVWAATRMFRMRKGVVLYMLGELITPAVLIYMLAAVPPSNRIADAVYIFVAIVAGISVLFIGLYSVISVKYKARFRGRTAR